jgi:hypothetical protein
LRKNFWKIFRTGKFSMENFPPHITTCNVCRLLGIFSKFIEVHRFYGYSRFRPRLTLHSKFRYMYLWLPFSLCVVLPSYAVHLRLTDMLHDFVLSSVFSFQNLSMLICLNLYFIHLQLTSNIFCSCSLFSLTLQCWHLSPSKEWISLIKGFVHWAVVVISLNPVHGWKSLLRTNRLSIWEFGTRLGSVEKHS